MDSRYEKVNGAMRLRVACHECEYGFNGMYKTCSAGDNEYICKELKRGCFAGKLIGGDKSEQVQEQKDCD